MTEDNYIVMALVFDAKSKTYMEYPDYMRTLVKRTTYQSCVDQVESLVNSMYDEYKKSDALGVLAIDDYICFEIDICKIGRNENNIELNVLHTYLLDKDAGRYVRVDTDLIDFEALFKSVNIEFV